MIEKLATDPYSTEGESSLPHAERVRWATLVSSMLDDMPDVPAKWAVALAMGSVITAGMSVEQMAAKAGCTENTLLKSAAGYCERWGLYSSEKLKHEWQERLAAAVLPKAG